MALGTYQLWAFLFPAAAIATTISSKTIPLFLFAVHHILFTLLAWESWYLALTVRAGNPGDGEGYDMVSDCKEEGDVCKRCPGEGARPPRTHHCGVCSKCVLRMDHHCPYLNQCIGRRNLSHYVRLHICMCYCAIWVAVQSIIVLFAEWKTGFMEHEMRYALTTGILLIISDVVMLCCGGLLAWSAFISWGGLTHVEYAILRRESKGGVVRSWTIREARALPREQGYKNLKELWDVRESWVMWMFCHGRLLGRMFGKKSHCLP